MCCFAQPVEAVTNTRLFARLASGGKQQLVYQMKFESKTPNAMILPLPVALPAREDSVRFISLAGYDDFFSDLNRGFPQLRTESRLLLSRSRPPTNAAAVDKLIVHEVGEFVASFVPTLADFTRLDPQFVIPNESWAKLPDYVNYGFAVFQLKELGGEPHPMAFEFETRWPERIYFPTVHIHDGEVHETEEFDHLLYLQHAAFDQRTGSYQGPEHRETATGFVRSNLPADQFCRIPATQGMVDSKLLVHRVSMRGRLPNRDVIKDCSAQAIRDWPRTSASYWPVLPGVFGIAGLGWLIRRRMQLSGRKSATKQSQG